MELLGGEKEEERKDGEKQRESRNKREEKLEIGKEEIKRAVKKIKLKKAAEIDGIPMEAWKYAGKDLWRKLVVLMKQVWKEGTRELEEKCNCTREATEAYR